VDNHAACLLIHPFASNHPVVAAGFFLKALPMTSVVKADGIFHRVLERTCPQLEQYMNQLEGVVPAKEMLYGCGQSVLDDGEVTVCRRLVSRSRALEVSQTCSNDDRGSQSRLPPPLMSVDLYPLASLEQIENTPSKSDGIPAWVEEDLRGYGCKLIAEAGVLLNQ
jgi:hypothetical protein